MKRTVVPGSEYLTPAGKPSGVGLLSNPSKMPGHSYDLPARLACPGAALSSKPVQVANDIANLSVGDIIDECDNCYAFDRGHYIQPVVKNALAVRFQWTRDSLRTPEGRAAWVATMVKAIRDSREPEFRGHSAGDLFSVAYIELWIEVCKQLPDVNFWFPTHSWWVPNLLPALRRLHALENVMVRPSALRVDAPAPMITGLGPGTTVITTHEAPNSEHICPANSRTGDDHGKCMDCRFCWTSPEAGAYPVH